MNPRRLMLAAATASVSVVALAAQPAAAAWQSPTSDVRLLSLNDFHGNLEAPTGSSGNAIDENGNTVLAGGASHIAAWMKKLTDRNTLKVGQGDLIGGTPLISAAYHDEPSVQFLNDIGLTASAVGNHEFDEGYDELHRIQWGGCHPKDGCSPEGKWKGAKFNYLAANVLKEKKNKPILKPWTIRYVNGVRVGFIGVVTKTTPTIVTAEGIKGLKFVDEVQAANKAARELKQRGIRSIVLLVHEGDQVQANNKPDSCGTVPGAGTRIATEADPEIDMVLAGHTHQQYVCSVKDPKGNPRLYSSGSSFGRVITQLDFKVNRRTGDVVRSTMKADNHVVTRNISDKNTEDFVAKWKDRVATIANKPIGKITADLTRTPSPTGETTLGNVIADAHLEATKGMGAQIAVTNSGGIRTDLTYKGDGTVTYGDAFAVQPFSNVTGVTSLTGAQLDKMLEQQWEGQPKERILQPSANFRFTIDRTRAVGDRVSNITVDGKPVEAATAYKISANNFLIGGGDGFTVFTEGTGAQLGPIDLDALVDYFGKHSPIAPPPLDRISGK